MLILLHCTLLILLHVYFLYSTPCSLGGGVLHSTPCVLVMGEVLYSTPCGHGRSAL